MDEEKKTIPTVTVSPGFSGLSIGRNLCLTLLGAGALGLMISISTVNDAARSWPGCWSAFAARVFGSAALRCCAGLLMRQDEDRRLWAGLLTGAVYVLVPALLFLLGVTDPMLRYRSRGSFQKQKEDE